MKITQQEFQEIGADVARIADLLEMAVTKLVQVDRSGLVDEERRELNQSTTLIWVANDLAESVRQRLQPEDGRMLEVGRE